MDILIKLLLNALAVFITANILPGIKIENFFKSILVAFVLAIVNALLKPILVILTLPVTIVTLGLFVFVINALMIMLVSKIVPGFKVDSFLWALLFSLLLSAVNTLLNKLIK